MSQIIMILLISLLVLVHEAGHFIAARMCGVRVTRFGIGMPFGPSWKMFKLGHTSFYLHSFLFGGYVSFCDDEENFKDNEEVDSDELLPSDSPELYENKTIAQKLFIVSAGVLMNIVFAFILVVLCASVFHKLPTSTQNVFVEGFIEEPTSNIQQLDIKQGDKFLFANGQKINTLYHLSFFAKNSKMFDDYAQEDLIQKNLDELKRLNPSLKDEIEAGVKVILPKQLEEKPLQVNENMLKGLEKYKKDGVQLSKEQIKLRDEIYNQKTYEIKAQTTLNDLAMALSDTYKPLEITLLRDGKEIILKNIIINEKGLVGVLLRYEDIYEDTKTPGDVLVKSSKYLYTTTTTMLYSLWQLFSGKVSISDMHGVIAVVKVGGDIITQKGLLNGLLLTAMISINLAIMNFLPIPALDGGHVMFLLIEKLTGKKPSKETGEKITNFFFTLLIMLMVAICYNDIFALITKKF